MEKLYINEDFYAWNCHWHWQLTGCCLCMCMLLDSQLGFKGTGHWFFPPSILNLTVYLWFQICLIAVKSRALGQWLNESFFPLKEDKFFFFPVGYILKFHSPVFNDYQSGRWLLATGRPIEMLWGLTKYCVQAPNTFYVQLFCRLLKLVKSQRVGTSNDKSALPFVNLPYLRNKLMARKSKTLNLFQTTAQGEGNTRLAEKRLWEWQVRKQMGGLVGLVHQCRCVCAGVCVS